MIAPERLRISSKKGSMALKYRLGIDLGTSSLGWAILRLDSQGQPCAVVKTGVRIFSTGRDPKTGTSLAVDRRLARQARRRRDRTLQRKNNLIDALTKSGLFPQDVDSRKKLESIDPYMLRAKGLDQELTPEEFGRALFHLNQRRGFKSNRKTDSKDSDSGAMKSAIRQLHQLIETGQARTVGEYLNQKRLRNEPIRARYRTARQTDSNGIAKVNKWYDLYVDRALVEQEFEALWLAQKTFKPTLLNQATQDRIKSIIFTQRPLKPVASGRCSIYPSEMRAAKALPCVQNFRILQELNNLAWTDESGLRNGLSLSERNELYEKLQTKRELSFEQVRKQLKLPDTTVFNLEDEKRQKLQGNLTAAILSSKELIGDGWFKLSEETQDDLVVRLLNETDETVLVRKITTDFAVSEETAEAISNKSLPEGYGSLSSKAIAQLKPILERQVITFAEAKHKQGLGEFATFTERDQNGQKIKVNKLTGEISTQLQTLPYYGKVLEAHVGFGTGNPDDNDEVRFGKIANPTVHIGLNQVRAVVNKIIQKYGNPTEVVVEVARDLRQTKIQKEETAREQAKNQKNRERIRNEISKALNLSPEQVKNRDVEKWQLWEELGLGAHDRRCPYSGKTISLQMVLSDATEVDHILPYSKTFDDSKSNKTLVTSEANRVKGNQTPWEAKKSFEQSGWKYEEILQRIKTAANPQTRRKAAKFSESAMQDWLGRSDSFLARALNDTRYLSRISRLYLNEIALESCRVIPGQMTALIRGKLGLNNVLSQDGAKNRTDHRHHAVDAVVIALTDQGLLQKFATASAKAESQHLNRLVDTLSSPWLGFLESVKFSIDHLNVSHKPDHGYQGAMHNDTAYGFLPDGQVHHHKIYEDKRVDEIENLKVIPISSKKASLRHGTNSDGTPKAYKGYKGDSNYCIEIFEDENGKWASEVISTFEAYQVVRKFGEERLRSKTLTQSGKKLVMRLMRNDTVTLLDEGKKIVVRVQKIGSNGQMAFAHLNEANVDARNRDGSYKFIFKSAGSLQKSHGKQTPIDEIGQVRS